jgi:hypothetical protein
MKRFKDFLKEEYQEKNFYEKLVEDPDIVDEVAGVIGLAIEHFEFNHDIKTADDFREHLLDSIVVDATRIPGDLDKQLDLCIFEENEGGGKCPETSWDELSGVISKHAVNGESIIADQYANRIADEFIEFMTSNKLSDYTQISWKDTYDYAAPKKVRSLKNGEIQEFRNLDGSFNVDQYTFSSSILDKIDLYVRKILPETTSKK